MIVIREEQDKRSQILKQNKYGDCYVLIHSIYTTVTCNMLYNEKRHNLNLKLN